MRLAFSLAIHIDAEVLLLDEIFAVGDEAFQQKCRTTMREFIAKGRTLMFVSHAASLVEEICNRVCVLSQGRKVSTGPSTKASHRYHDITAAGAD